MSEIFKQITDEFIKRVENEKIIEDQDILNQFTTLFKSESQIPDAQTMHKILFNEE